MAGAIATTQQIVNQILIASGLAMVSLISCTLARVLLIDHADIKCNNINHSGELPLANNLPPIFIIMLQCMQLVHNEECRW